MESAGLVGSKFCQKLQAADIKPGNSTAFFIMKTSPANIGCHPGRRTFSNTQLNRRPAIGWKKHVTPPRQFYKSGTTCL